MTSLNPSADVLPATPDAGTVRGVKIAFENSYVRLPERFYARLRPTPVAAPRLVKLNVGLARELGLDPDALASPEGVEVLAGNRVAEGSAPLSQAYAGHQFGHFVPQLGDGRAILLGEVIARNGNRYDIQLKGAGRTPFSRGGDGRAVLGPVLREYLVSEAMAALGVPTTRALAAVTTGEMVLRETALPGAVFTRVASSHLRVGTFQFFAARGDAEGVRTLADYAIARHYPEASHARKPYRAFLEGVIGSQASLVAQWMSIGFIHGVLNTDNTSISGETIDYGPCAFMEAYDTETVFSSIDRAGRYAYGSQPGAMSWNLMRLAEALLPVLGGEEGSEEAALTSANEALAGFGPQFELAYETAFRHKLGLAEQREGDRALISDLLERMTANRVDFTLFFRRLCDAAAGPEGDEAVRSLFSDPAAYDTWAGQWRKRISDEGRTVADSAATMRGVNPAYIPRNHQVEAALQAAILHGDFGPFEELLAVVSRPYEERPDLQRFAAPASPHEYVRATFCGT